MELKDFIKTALTDITNAVSELQGELKNGAIVSPSLPKVVDKTIEIDNKNVILTQVAFDVAITAGGTDMIKGGAKGGLNVFSAKVDGSNEEHTENVSHVSFSMPIVLPQHRIKSEQEQSDEELTKREFEVRAKGQKLRERERKTLDTFDQMLRMFGKKSVNGEGYLWNRYMRGWVDATEKEYTGYQNALKTLDEKVSEVFGKNMKWGDLFAMERKLPKATVTFWDGGEQKDHELTQGNLLYIYMVDKMADGRMKLRRMGITEEDVENIKDFVDPRFLELADWMQEEFLVGKRNEYNEVHKRMFGASMAAIENYFPLKILANARIEDVDVADDTTDTVLPATSTGSIIKRRRNNLALDVMGADAFSVILDHVQQMERWAAFAEFNRDLNTLLSYKHFRNQVMNMSSVYGGGKTLWNNFRNVCTYNNYKADFDRMNNDADFEAGRIDFAAWKQRMQRNWRRRSGSGSGMSRNGWKSKLPPPKTNLTIPALSTMTATWR